MRNVAFWISLALIFVIPWENVISIGDLGTTGARAAGFLLGAFWIFTVVVSGRFRKPRPFHVAVYLFMLWNVVSALWSVDVDLTLVRLESYFQLAAMVFILWDLYGTPAALRAGLQAYVLGGYVAIVGTIANYISGNEGGYIRYAAPGFDPNDLGVTLALGIPLAWHLALHDDRSSKSHLLRLVNFAYIPSAILAILLTASRGALIAALAALLFVLWSLSRLKPSSRVFIGAALAASLFVLQSLVPQSNLSRLGTIGASIAQVDLGGRVNIWRQGIAEFSEHPLTGIGSGAFRAALESGAGAHNTFLDVLVGVGIIGFALFAIILAMVVYHAIHQPRWQARLWLTILLVWALGAFSLGWIQRKPTWLFLGLVLVSANLVKPPDESIHTQGILQKEF